MTNKVLIAIPTVDGWIHAKLVQSLIPMLPGNLFCLISGMVPVEKARNAIAKTFLETDCTHLFQIDADTIPPLDALVKLLALDTDMATAITPIVNREELTSNLFMGSGKDGDAMPWEEAINKKEPFEIKGVGMACILIKREVFEKVGTPFYTDAWFKDGSYCEGDINFCGKAIDAGFKLVVDPTIICGHYKEVMM